MVVQAVVGLRRMRQADGDDEDEHRGDGRDGGDRRQRNVRLRPMGFGGQVDLIRPARCRYTNRAAFISR